jgi:hypothetical protein
MVVPELRATLAKAGASPTDRDDLVQETATRLLRMWDRIDWDRSVEALACRIALNAWRDQWRRLGDRERLGELPEQAGGSDTERAALARVEVREVSRAMASMRPATAAVLRLAAREAEGPDGPLRLNPAARMARTRARRALAATLKAASAFVAAVTVSGRWLRRGAKPGPAAAALTGLYLIVGASSSGAVRLPLTPTQVQPATESHPAVQSPAPLRSAPAAPRPRAVPSIATHRAGSRRDLPYYVVPVGPVKVRVFASLDIQGYGVRIAKPAPGTAQPACTYGATPTVPLVPTCA